MVEKWAISFPVDNEPAKLPSISLSMFIASTIAVLVVSIFFVMVYILFKGLYIKRNGRDKKTGHTI